MSHSPLQSINELTQHFLSVSYDINLMWWSFSVHHECPTMWLRQPSSPSAIRRQASIDCTQWTGFWKRGKQTYGRLDGWNHHLRQVQCSQRCIPTAPVQVRGHMGWIPWPHHDLEASNQANVQKYTSGLQLSVLLRPNRKTVRCG